MSQMAEGKSFCHHYTIMYAIHTQHTQHKVTHTHNTEHIQYAREKTTSSSIEGSYAPEFTIIEIVY